MTKEDIDRMVDDIHVHSCPPKDEVTCPRPRRENGPNLNPRCKDCWRGWLTKVDPPRELEPLSEAQKRVGYERQGAGYDPGACGHELQGRSGGPEETKEK